MDHTRSQRVSQALLNRLPRDFDLIPRVFHRRRTSMARTLFPSSRQDLRIAPPSLDRSPPTVRDFHKSIPVSSLRLARLCDAINNLFWIVIIGILVFTIRCRHSRCQTTRVVGGRDPACRRRTKNMNDAPMGNQSAPHINV